MEYKDYYKTLGVPKTATEKEIKAAYRKLARKHHPDVNSGNKQAEARFKEIGEAYEVLSDGTKRQRYDQLGADWSAFGPRGGPRPREGGRVRVHVGGFGHGDAPGFSEFFRTFFGGGFGGDPEVELGGQGFGPFGAGSGEVEHGVDLTLEEVLRGATRSLRIGEGPKGHTVEVRIPAGVREGARVRVPGEAAAGPRGRRGDVYLRVHLLPDPRFEVKGDDLHATVTVPLTTAVLGGEAQVATLDGPVGIKIPPETPVGRVFRLRGHGLPTLGAGTARGDVLATLGVDLRPGLSARERELFEELRRLGR